jgi:hypothetical protein
LYNQGSKFKVQGSGFGAPPFGLRPHKQGSKYLVNSIRENLTPEQIQGVLIIPTAVFTTDHRQRTTDIFILMFNTAEIEPDNPAIIRRILSTFTSVSDSLK